MYFIYHDRHVLALADVVQIDLELALKMRIKTDFNTSERASDFHWYNTKLMHLSSLLKSCE